MKSLSVELRLKVVLVGQTWSNLFKPGKGFASWPPGQPWFLQKYTYPLFEQTLLLGHFHPHHIEQAFMGTPSKLATALLQKGNPYQSTWTTIFTRIAKRTTFP